MEKRSVRKNMKYWMLALGLAGAMLVVGGLYVYHWESRIPTLDVHFLSLKRGRATFVRTPENRTILVGGGQTSEVIREITKLMPFYKRKIDYVIIPSAVPAQIGGLVEIMDRYEIGQIFLPKILATSTALIALEQKIRAHKIHVVEVERGEVIKLGPTVTMTMLFPYKEFKFNKTSLPELGFVLSYDSTHVYFMGNLSKTIQKDIVKNTMFAVGRNILEFYNSAGESKVFAELVEKLAPTFTFSTKEKTTHVVSSGEEWTIPSFGD